MKKQETERKLTAAEEERKKAFEEVSQKMRENGYTEKSLIISISEANKKCIGVMLPFMLAILLLYTCVNKTELFSVKLLVWQCPFTLLLTVVHELIHGITWAIFAKEHFKSIRVGVIWKALTPYCNCKEPLEKWQYILGAAMPTLILGIGLGLYAVITGNLLWLYVAEFMILGGGGDALIIRRILQYRSDKKEQVCHDHPYECGVVIFEK